jgi:uncharacterized protein
MALAPELEEILACPRCKGGLQYHAADGELRCLRCRLAFRVEDGIPVMLVGEARPLDGGGGPGDPPPSSG